jgi:hypothetical protein
MTEYIEKLKHLLFRRQYVFRQTFKGPLAHEVLKDLARFCRAFEPTFNVDDRTHALLEGRREVWLRIQNHLNLSPEDLWSLHSGRPAVKPEDV